jgi:hypothetical protein
VGSLTVGYKGVRWGRVGGSGTRAESIVKGSSTMRAAVVRTQKISEGI